MRPIFKALAIGVSIVGLSGAAMAASDEVNLESANPGTDNVNTGDPALRGDAIDQVDMSQDEDVKLQSANPGTDVDNDPDEVYKPSASADANVDSDGVDLESSNPGTDNES